MPKTLTIPPHPMQPLVVVDGIIRFRKNAIVRALLDHCSNLPGEQKLGLNELADRGFTNEDFEQFAQLIGYSVGGFAELSYVSDEACERADKEAKPLRKIAKRRPNG